MPRTRSQRNRPSVYFRLQHTEHKFRLSCQQIVLLNQRLDDLQLRYHRAVKAEQRSFRYSLRLRMAVLEGVRNMYYEYACRKADDLTDLRCQIFGPNSDDEDDSTEDGEGEAEGAGNEDTSASEHGADDNAVNVT